MNLPAFGCVAAAHFTRQLKILEITFPPVSRSGQPCFAMLASSSL
jgi:hypothetical protein